MSAWDDIGSAPLFNFEAEQSVLGALLADSARAWPVIGMLTKPEHFYEGVNARIFEAAASLASAGKIASLVTLKNIFDADGTLQELGGTQYFARLVAMQALPMSLKPHAELLRDLAARRALRSAANDIIADAECVTADAGVRPAIAAGIEKLQRIFDDGAERRTTFTIGEATAAMVDRVAHIRAGESDPNAVKAGIGCLDKFTGGLHRGEYLILGGRPSMGKTALAVQLAYNVASNNGGIFYASLEMPVTMLTPRFVSCRLWSGDNASSIDYQRILRGEIDAREMRWIESARDEMATWPLIIDEDAGLSAPEVEDRARIAKAKLERQGRTLDLIVIDHLHKMRHAGARSPVNEYTEISARLAEMAKRLDVPVLALAQLNRAVESRDDKRPQLADLRESGSIEQDADTVLFCYREGYYLERKRCSEPTAEADRRAKLEHVGNRLELIIEKQRSGPIGPLELWCDMAANVVRDRADISGSGMELAA